ncbi:MAG TPA: ATP-grasp domain-containing protein [Mobilitalea sp.]|nr:ATP-grasp domain-containing protein [Mobilitalea sp.]
MERIPENDSPNLLRVGLTYNLKKNIASDVVDNEAEYDNIDTVLAIKAALEDDNCKVELMEATEELPIKLADHAVDIVFNIAEGIHGRGREAQVPAILNFFKIPFTGSDETTLCIALDKALTKRILTTYHIRTPKYRVISKDQQKPGGSFTFPAIVKPNAEGSSKGISDVAIVANMGELRSLVSKNLSLYKQDMLIEEYIPGREFTVGVLGNGSDVRVFPPMEIVYLNKQVKYNIYSYNVKQDYKKLIRYECPAAISPEIESEIKVTAKRIFEILGCKDFARIDFRLTDDGKPYFIEINPLPGLAPGYSDFPMLAEFNGMDYVSLVRNVLKSAVKRYGLKFYLK